MTIVRLTLREAANRKVLLVGAVISTATAGTAINPSP